MVKKVLLRIGALLAAIGVFYSGLMFLGFAPADLSMRFWNGGAAALMAAAVLDIACGSVLAYLVVNILLGVAVKRHARNAVTVCVIAVLSDWIGGLYGISASTRVIRRYFTRKVARFLLRPAVSPKSVSPRP